MSADYAEDAPEQAACGMCAGTGHLWLNSIRRLAPCSMCRGAGVITGARDALWWTTVRPEPRPKPEPRPRKPRKPRSLVTSLPYPPPRPPVQRRRRLALPLDYGAQGYVYADHPEVLTAGSLPFGVAFVYRCKDAAGKVVLCWLYRYAPGSQVVLA